MISGGWMQSFIVFVTVVLHSAIPTLLLLLLTVIIVVVVDVIVRD